jgi:predicted RecB family endonuclease
MKINVTLTKQELLEILTAHFGHTVEDATVIVEPTIAQIIRNAVTQLDYKISQKIAAIKALRQLAVDNKWTENVIGLGDAKWAIENFTAFIDFVEKNHRLPKPGYSEGLK